MNARFPKPFARRQAQDRFTPLTRGQRQTLAGARRLARFMDSQFSVGGFRFGFDAIIGLIPGVGDGVAGIASIYMIVAARQLGLPRSKIATIGAIGVVDFVIGLMPFAGDAADAVFKPHVRSLRIIEDHLRGREGVSVESVA